MRSVGVRELKEHTSRILRLVQEEGEEVQITHHGRAIARLVPASKVRQGEEEAGAVWADLDRLAEEIGARWPEGVTAAEAVREERRDL